MEGHIDKKFEKGSSPGESGLNMYDNVIYVDFPKKYKRKISDSFDKRFVIIWLITLIVHVSLTYYFSKHLESQKINPVQIQEIQQQFARLVLKKEVKEKPVEKKLTELITPERQDEEQAIQGSQQYGGQGRATAPAERNVQNTEKVGGVIASRGGEAEEKTYHVPVARNYNTPNRESFRIISQNVADKGILGLLGSSSEQASGKAVEEILSEADLAHGKFKKTLSNVNGIRKGQSESEILAQRQSRVQRRERSSNEADISGFIAERENLASASMSRKKTLEKTKQTTIRQKEPQLVGQRDPDDISAVVNRHNAAIQACYQRELRRNPDLKGKIVVRFTISYQGRVTHVELLSSTLNNERVERCVLSRIRRWDDFGVIDRNMGDTTFRQVYTFGY